MHLCALLLVVFAVGRDGAVQAKRLWTSTPADPNNIMMTAYTIGNGKQACLPLGIPGNDVMCLNHDSLWRGGPFANSSYMGGNPQDSLAHFLPGIRQDVFQHGTGDESALYGSTADYGSYEMMGNLTVDIQGVETYTNYKRYLDLDTAVHTTTYDVGEANYVISQFCSFPDQVCVYHVRSNQLLPNVTIGMTDDYRTKPASMTSCSSQGIHFSGRTTANDGEGEIGMKFDAQVRVLGAEQLEAQCAPGGRVLIPSRRSKLITVIVASGTEYDQKKGNSANDYSFRGPSPYPSVLKTSEKAYGKCYGAILNRHIRDHQKYYNRFSLELPDPHNSANVDSAKLFSEYSTEKGDPFVENLVVDYGKYMYIASSRPGSLPPNLQGKWAASVNPAWSSDYHIDVNVQMNNWHAEQMGLGDLMDGLWDFMIDTWMPRGAESARLLYNASGWTAFSNLNIFGHTGQGNDATWSDTYHDPAWMMATVWDRYDYGRDEKWYQSTGYVLLKSIAQFWLDMLVEDDYFHDGSLVANPCNSPEQGPTTFGCAQFQQVVWEVFDHILRDWDASGDTDSEFLGKVKNAFAKLDTGVHVGRWGQIQEWKMDIDTENNTHRHLSHLNGWFPGYAIAGPHANNKTIIDAVATSLYSRGNGTEDSNTGWEKTLRAACWARLGVVDEAYMEFKYTIDMNFAPNALSVYTQGVWPYELALPFQIDANFGQAAAALSMLAIDIPTMSKGSMTQMVTLGPSIPAEWAGGRVQGLRLRGGGYVDFTWDSKGIVHGVTLHDRQRPLKIVNKLGKVLASV